MNIRLRKESRVNLWIRIIKILIILKSQQEMVIVVSKKEAPVKKMKTMIKIMRKSLNRKMTGR